MEVEVLNFSTYQLMFSDITERKEPLIGTQSIYSTELQATLIQTFMDTDNENQMIVPSVIDDTMRTYCFSVDNVIFHPTLTCHLCPSNYIFVSDELFNQYFSDSNKPIQKSLKFYYALPKVQDIKLKRIDGNFPRDDSLESLLTHYFESCMVINK